VSQEHQFAFSLSEIETKLKSRPFYALFFNIVLLSIFFIQALRVYLPGVYVAMFHVVFGENIVENLLILLTLIFFVIPAFTNTICKIIGIRRVMISSIYIMAIARLLIAFHLPNLWQTILSGIIVTTYGMFISTFLTLWIKDESTDIKRNNKITMVIFSFLCAFVLDYLIRTIGFSQDISLLPPGFDANIWYITQYLWLIVQIPLTVLCIYFTILYFPRFTAASDLNIKEESKTKRKRTVYSLVFMGIGMFWFLLFNIFLYPNMIAHYTATSYYISNILSISALIATIMILLYVNRRFTFSIKTLVILNGFMIVSVCLFLFLGTTLAYVAVILISISLIIMYLNFFILLSYMSTVVYKWEKVKTISNIFAIGLVFYVLFTVFHIFTTDWAYVISAFKGYGPVIILIAVIIFSISSVLSIQLNQTGRE